MNTCTIAVTLIILIPFIIMVIRNYFIDKFNDKLDDKIAEEHYYFKLWGDKDRAKMRKAYRSRKSKS